MIFSSFTFHFPLDHPIFYSCLSTSIYISVRIKNRTIIGNCSFLKFEAACNAYTHNFLSQLSR